MLWGQFSGHFPEMALTLHSVCLAHNGEEKKQTHRSIAAFVCRVSVSVAPCELWIDSTVPPVFPSVPKLSPCVPRQRHGHV